MEEAGNRDGDVTDLSLGEVAVEPRPLFNGPSLECWRLGVRPAAAARNLCCSRHSKKQGRQRQGACRGEGHEAGSWIAERACIRHIKCMFFVFISTVSVT